MNAGVTSYEQIFRRLVRHSECDLVAVGGGLNAEILLAAYQQGAFPCYGEDESILWWSPLERCLLQPQHLHLSRSVLRMLKRVEFTLSIDSDFARVVQSCANASRPESGVWLHTEVQQSYLELHRLGYAHSVEIWQEGELTGGLYGLALGRCFCGESMFHHRSYASRVGFLVLARYLFQQQNFHFIDCQQTSAHMLAMGARPLNRDLFLNLLDRALRPPSLQGNWQKLLPDFPRSSNWLLK